jgi:predicted nuclease of predicted toxin-antitoxin system
VKIKLDENLPLSLAEALKKLGHDVHSVFDEGLNGRPDTEVWGACCAENRFLITQDLDFSDFRKYPPGSHAGILVVRFVDDSRENLLKGVLTAFQSYPVEEWKGAMVSLTEVKLRVRKP